jgi:hypothetical protein
VATVTAIVNRKNSTECGCPNLWYSWWNTRNRRIRRRSRLPRFGASLGRASIKMQQLRAYQTKRAPESRKRCRRAVRTSAQKISSWFEDSRVKIWVWSVRDERR